MDEGTRRLAEQLLAEGLPVEVEWLIGEADREQLVSIDGDEFRPGGVHLAKTWRRALSEDEVQAVSEYLMDKYS